MTLYILKYNNYYNRLVKKEDSLEAYMLFKNYELFNTNFNPNDSVNTQHVIGNGDYDGKGDYLIAVNDDSEIVSRWFIINSERTRAGQWQLTLHRDVVVDYYNVIVGSPMFIEKATITDVNDPAIFNREGMTFNQIKQSENFLTDETHCPWIVGYIPETVVKDNDYNGKQLIFDYSIESKDFIEVDSLPEWDGYRWYSGAAVYAGELNEIYYGYGVNVPAGLDNKYYIGEGDSGTLVRLSNSSLPYNGYYLFKDGSPLVPYLVPYDTKYTSTTALWNVFNTWIPSGRTNYNPGFQEFTESSSILGDTNIYTYRGAGGLPPCRIENITKNQIYQAYKLYRNLNFDPTDFKNKYDGLLLKDNSTGLMYKVRVAKQSNLRYRKDWLTYGEPLYDLLNNNLNKTGPTVDFGVIKEKSTLIGNPNNYTYFISASYDIYTLELEPLYQFAGVTLDSSVYELNDQPFYMFCIPYTNNVSVMKGTNYKYRFSKELSISLATQFSGLAGKANIFDIQLLPFCPARYAVKAFIPTPGWHITNEETGEGAGTGEYAKVTTPYIFDENLFSGLFQPIYKGTKTGEADPVLGNEEIGKLFWAPSSNFSFDIEYSIPTKETALDIKVSSETELYRLCSPNYSGVFEFDPYMNNGVQTFNVDCNYKPFNPYIHVNPVFNYLYGSDFNDQRGLVILGDFSLPQETNAWTDYELANKNYQAMFDRGIQNLKVNQDVLRKQQVFNAVTGSISGGVSGAVSGSVGGPLGALTGAFAGTAASSIGGALDVKYGDILRNEALSYATDMFNYNLGNIQALPNGMTKTSPLTENFKYYPFIEKYDCTSVEKQAFKNKLYYNGMTVMRIGTINQYLNDDLSYIKGKLIRLEGSNEDYRVINSIAGELDKGVYI